MHKRSAAVRRGIPNQTHTDRAANMHRVVDGTWLRRPVCIRPSCAPQQPVYGRFTEGFDTPDLKDANALLGEPRDLSITSIEGPGVRCRSAGSSARGASRPERPSLVEGIATGNDGRSSPSAARGQGASPTLCVLPPTAGLMDMSHRSGRPKYFRVLVGRLRRAQSFLRVGGSRLRLVVKAVQETELSRNVGSLKISSAPSATSAALETWAWVSISCAHAAGDAQRFLS
jgi:hypothetical protein